MNISIYVFSYNRPKFLKRCIDSVSMLAADLPYYVIDDGSDDPSIMRLLSRDEIGLLRDLCGCFGFGSFDDGPRCCVIG